MPRGFFYESLITEVARRPLLWDVENTSYRNRTSKESLWEEVRDALLQIDEKITVDEVISRWKNLKYTLRRKIKEEKDKQKSGAGATAKSAWPYLQQMEFLRDTVQTRRSFCSLGPMDCLDEQVSVPADQTTPAANTSITTEGPKEPEHCQNGTEEIFATPGIPDTDDVGLSEAPSTNQDGPPSRPHKRQKRPEVEAIDRELQAVRSAIAAHRPMDAFSHFLLPLQPLLQATPANMRMHLKMELIHICGMYGQGLYPTSLAVNPSQP